MNLNPAVQGSWPSKNDPPGPATRAQWEQSGKNGANWFFWIAGLSLVNTVIIHSGGDVHFIVGLALTAFVDGVAIGLGQKNPDQASTFVVVAIMASILISAVACLFGWAARKKQLVIFGLGMGVYLLDGLFYLVFRDFASAAFHGYALLMMFNGFNSFRKLKQADDAEFYGDDEDTDAEPKAAS